MKVDIYIKEVGGNREIRIPWLPDEIEYGTGDATLASYDIMNKGEVAVPTGVGLATYAWSSIFPGKGRQYSTCGLMRGEWKSPTSYHNILNMWKAEGKKLNLTVIGYPINKTVYLTKYSGKANGPFGDMEYSVEFIEAKSIIVSSTELALDPKRDKEYDWSTHDWSTYKVKAGDTLWEIAEKYYGEGIEWSLILDENRDIIEKTARDAWGAAGINRGSQNGRWIFPGTILKIPSVKEMAENK